MLLAVLMVITSPRKTAGSLGLPRSAYVAEAATVRLGSLATKPKYLVALASGAEMEMLEPSPVVPEEMENLAVSGLNATVIPKRALEMAGFGGTAATAGGPTTAGVPATAGVSVNSPIALLMAISSWRAKACGSLSVGFRV